MSNSTRLARLHIHLCCGSWHSDSPRIKAPSKTRSRISAFSTNSSDEVQANEAFFTEILPANHRDVSEGYYPVLEIRRSEHVLQHESIVLSSV